jgi:hypothetical protein
MIVRILAIALLSSILVEPADAGFYLYWRNGSVTYFPDEIVLFAGLVAVAACLGLFYYCIENTSSSSSRIAQMNLDLPDEVRELESVEHYDEMTARTRALKEKLDADTGLAESYINAARARAALDDLEDLRRQPKRPPHVSGARK